LKVLKGICVLNEIAILNSERFHASKNGAGVVRLIQIFKNDSEVSRA
jgi:hypothetical protein